MVKGVAEGRHTVPPLFIARLVDLFLVVFQATSLEFVCCQR